MNNNLHIVCLDAPAPPDYGGAIDMYYKIKALAAIGKKIILHYYDYRPTRNVDGLENDCVEVHAYKRKGFFQAVFSINTPYIIQSRINGNLIQRLNDDDHPILLEGLHCAGIIPFIKNKQRLVLRMHNEEASYYHHLATNESRFVKQLYFTAESKRLKKYQQHTAKDIKLACLSQTDMTAFQSEYHFRSVHLIPCFIPWQQVNIKEGSSAYCLYHGNLSVSENESAASWLIENVFSQLSVPFVITGKGISSKLRALARHYSNIKLLPDLPIDELNEIVRDAHINVLPSMNCTGVKLKLLNALLNGRFCITNHNGVMGSGLEKFTRVIDSPVEWIATIESLIKIDFSIEEAEQRKAVLQIYNNQANAQKLSELW